MAYVRKIVLCGMIFGFASLPAKATDVSSMVSDSMTINAPVKVVWEAIRTLRRNDPAHRKVISSNNGDYVVEEKFESIPVIGAAVCTYKEHETPMQKLEFEMTSSDKFKAFEGQWELSPTADGKTLLKLSSRTDTGIKIPFADRITKCRTSKTIERRLEEVREISSKTQVAMK